MSQMQTRSFNTKRDLREFVNESGLTKEQIVNIFPDEGLYTIVYYAE